MADPLVSTATNPNQGQLDDADLRARIRELRANGRNPKVIARTLGLRPADVTHLIRQIASEEQASPAEPELVGCWVSPGWSNGLGFDHRADWPERPFTPPDGSDPELAVLVSVLVARRDRRRRLSACGYLIDTGCLGVKNAVGPLPVADRRLLELVSTYFQAYEAPPLPAPLELAQQLVYGAEEYAQGLGFESHPDFAAAKGHLGEWTGPSAITFGRNGQPFYIEGPYDDSATILRTLDRTVGRGNYHYLVASNLLSSNSPDPLSWKPKATGVFGENRHRSALPRPMTPRLRSGAM